jgi:hypothetical protein
MRAIPLFDKFAVYFAGYAWSDKTARASDENVYVAVFVLQGSITVSAPTAHCVDKFVIHK